MMAAPTDSPDMIKPPMKAGLDGIIANAQGSGEDYIADTFAQFGLNINNLLMGGDESKANEDSPIKEAG